jgi:hypothetical protein
MEDPDGADDVISELDDAVEDETAPAVPMKRRRRAAKV